MARRLRRPRTSLLRVVPAALLPAALLPVALLLAGCGGSDEAPAPSASAAASGAPAAAAGGQVLLDAERADVLDQPLAYPRKGAAEVSSELVTLEPGQETGWHRHRVPQYVYVLEGTVTVEYEPAVLKEYGAGTAYLEAEDVWHNATNAGDDTVRMLTVYLGAEGAKNTVERGG